MRQALLLFFLFAAATSWAQPAETLSKIPDPLKASNSFVYDPAGRMDAYSRQSVNGLLHLLNKETNAQGAVAFLPTIGDDIPKDFATALFRKWGIGNAGTDEGYLLLIVEDQRRAEIETGYGMEAILTDALAKRVLTNEFIPYMKRGERGSAVLATVRAIDLIYRGTKGLDSIPSVEYSQYMDPLKPVFGGHDEIYDDISPNANKYPYLDRIPRPKSTENWAERNPLLVVYISANFVFHLFLSIWVIVVYFDKETLHDKWRRLRWWQSLFWCFIFPFPYVIMTYPILSRYLTRLRHMPRYAKGNGQPMRRLSEKEEDEFLEHGHIIEEEVGSIDHDVWISSDLSEVLVLPYAKRLHGYKACPSCSYKTYKATKSKIITRATTSRSGKREVTYSCKACHYQKKELQTIPRKSNSSSGGGGFSGGGGGGSSFGGGSSGGGGSGASW